jgi:hypothetical protein
MSKIIYYKIKEYNMGKVIERVVYKRDDGQWANKKNSASKVSSLHSTQKEAEQAAKEMLKNEGGGELIIKGLNGQIRSKDTISKG